MRTAHINAPRLQMQSKVHRHAPRRDAHVWVTRRTAPPGAPPTHSPAPPSTPTVPSRGHCGGHSGTSPTTDLLHNVKVLLGGLLEEASPDGGALAVQQVARKQCALPALVPPRLLVALVSHAAGGRGTRGKAVTVGEGAQQLGQPAGRSARAKHTPSPPLPAHTQPRGCDAGTWPHAPGLDGPLVGVRVQAPDGVARHGCPAARAHGRPRRGPAASAVRVAACVRLDLGRGHGCRRCHGRCIGLNRHWVAVHRHRGAYNGQVHHDANPVKANTAGRGRPGQAGAGGQVVGKGSWGDPLGGRTGHSGARTRRTRRAYTVSSHTARRRVPARARVAQDVGCEARP